MDLGWGPLEFPKLVPFLHPQKEMNSCLSAQIAEVQRRKG